MDKEKKKIGSKHTESECNSDDDVESEEDFLIIELTYEEDDEKGFTARAQYEEIVGGRVPMVKHLTSYEPTELWFNIKFDLDEIDRSKLFKLEDELYGLGVDFDSGTNLKTGEREWEIDWSLTKGVSRDELLNLLKTRGIEYKVEVRLRDELE